MIFHEEFFHFLKTQTDIDLDSLQKKYRDYCIEKEQTEWDYYEEPYEFKLTKNHIKLLKSMNVSWQKCETGAPEINPKRPYGNSDVAHDVGTILGRKPRGNDGDPDYYSNSQEEKFLRLHRETETALQIVLQFGSFETGTFYRENTWDEWEKIK